MYFDPFLIIIVGLILCLIILFIIFFTQRYIQNEGQKSGFTKKEIEKWQFKAVLYGSLFGLYLFKKEISKNHISKI